MGDYAQKAHPVICFFLEMVTGVFAFFSKCSERVVVGGAGFRILMLAGETFASESQIHAVELNSLLG